MRLSGGRREPPVPSPGRGRHTGEVPVAFPAGVLRPGKSTALRRDGRLRFDDTEVDSSEVDSVDQTDARLRNDQAQQPGPHRCALQSRKRVMRPRDAARGSPRSVADERRLPRCTRRRIAGTTRLSPCCWSTGPTPTSWTTSIRSHRQTGPSTGGRKTWPPCWRFSCRECRPGRPAGTGIEGDLRQASGHSDAAGRGRPVRRSVSGPSGRTR
jgi:hypothetical protein